MIKYLTILKLCHTDVNSVLTAELIFCNDTHSVLIGGAVVQ